MREAFSARAEGSLGTASETRQKSSSLRRIVANLLHRSKRYRAIFVAGGFGYWLLFAFSTGIIFYYPMDVGPQYVGYLSFISDLGSLDGLYSSGIVWIPNGHLEIVLLYSNVIFSIILSTLFALNILLAAYSFSVNGVSKRKSSLGVLGIIPTLFTSGCCAVPVATLLFGSIVPSAVLITVEFGNPFLLDLGIAILMLASLYYYAHKTNADKEQLLSCKAEDRSQQYHEIYK